MSLVTVSIAGYPQPGADDMIGPARNRLHDYEAGWLTLLVSMRVATEAEARETWRRVAQKGIDDMNERKARRGKHRRRRKRPE